MNKPVRILLRIALVVLAAAAAAAVLAAAFLTVAEYRPDEVEPLTVSGEAERTLSVGEPVRVMTWNIGYGALGDNADFFMDGGSSVMTASKDRVEQNLTDITEEITAEDPDLLLLQEVDVNSARSHHIDETKWIGGKLKGDYAGAFAANFKVPFVPYPIPPVGKVDSGILTFSRLSVSDAVRMQLPVPFSWPVRTANLKRCMTVERLPVEGSSKELVLINLHLEAYDSGEGKLAQTNMLKGYLESEAHKGNYIIVGGDFNQTFSNVKTDMYPQKEGTWKCGRIDTSLFEDFLLFLMDSSTPTCRSLDQPYDTFPGDKSDFQYYVIDGFIVSDNIIVNSVKTKDLGFRASDHNPVIGEFILEARELQP
ncbi:MAG: endonuclease/exonuclease/phosphatase family protein [Lachnospiraceae bacterium]|nr:endonuclease/exonuclease/phosphatase family protein [Lachnospiraceae bacterium]